ncbi:MAG: DUF262 domain-containing protein [Burkholderiaceae bacterium]|nr:MAG: DUF262 domain-containing protein [Burkholderiaceae bacterium]
MMFQRMSLLGRQGVRKDSTMTRPNKPHHLSDKHWLSLSDAHKALYALVRPLAKATYEVDVQLSHVEEFITRQSSDMAEMGGTLELEPDFQRGHVWTDEQQVRYVESLLRGIAPRSIIFNCPGWSRDTKSGDIPPNTFQCVDGLQRLTAVRKFMNGNSQVFGDLCASNLKGSPFDPSRYTLKISVYEFENRADLLQFYIDLNSGGTVHGSDELDRVRRLRDQTRRSENMNYGQSQAVMVLAGERLGFQMENATLAKKILGGESVHPMFFAFIENEATAFHNRIRNQPELVEQANQHCVAIAAEYALPAARATGPEETQNEPSLRPTYSGA